MSERAAAVERAPVFDARGSYDDAFVLMLALSVLATALTFTIRERLITATSESLLMRQC